MNKVKIAAWSDLADREPQHALVADVDLVVVRAGRIHVTVTGTSESGISVEATYQGKAKQPVASKITFASKGRAMLKGLHPGRWKVEAMAGERKRSTTVEVTAGKTARVTLAF